MPNEINECKREAEGEAPVRARATCSNHPRGTHLLVQITRLLEACETLIESDPNSSPRLQDPIRECTEILEELRPPRAGHRDVISFVHYCAAEQVSIARQVKYLVQVKVAALRLQRLGSSLRAACKTIRLVNSTAVSAECL